MIDQELKDNWLYQEIVEEGRMEVTRQSIKDVVGDKFPNLMGWVKEQVEPITDLATLRLLLRRVALINSEDEIRAAFAAVH